jgi:CO dehydrogenase maturation factor
LPAGLAERVEGKGWQPVKGFRPARLVERHAAHAPDGVRYLELGKLPGNLEQSRVIAFRAIMDRFRGEGWTVVADLAAGTRQPYSGWVGFASTVIVVADPSAKALLSARRLLSVATHVVANKIRTPGDLKAVTDAVPLPLLAAIPYDETLAESERRGLAPIDVVPDAPAVRAVAELARKLSGRET